MTTEATASKLMLVWRRGLVLAMPLVAAIHCLGPQPLGAQTVATYHGNAGRSGNFTMPAFTWEAARLLRLDPNFAPRFPGHLYAQPLYWRPPGRASGMLIVASESNTVTAIDAAGGATLWSRTLGVPAPLSAFGCGNIDPLGITGTPVIDEAGGTLYLDAMVAQASGPRHLAFALSLGDGSVSPGWPIDVGEALRSAGHSFASRVQNQRGALLIQGGMLYIPYGGFYGDCGDYHGWVVGLPLHDPRRVSAWRTRGRGGGIWAPGGVASDGKSLYAATGNTMGAAEWADGEAVFRLAPDLRHSGRTGDFFAAADWHGLDARDADLGGTNPLPLDLPEAAAAQPVVLALGKDGRAYLLDRQNLGGIGGSLVAQPVSTGPIRTAPAAYPVAGGVRVAFEGPGANCPSRQGRGGVTVLHLRAGSPPAIETAWCGTLSGAGAPIVTTTDGRANPIVWILGAEGDNRLYGFHGDTGELLFTSSPLVSGLRHFQTLIAADDRLFVGADGRLYAFGIAP
jgi:outer membrane protein assembly factor BamB